MAYKKKPKIVMRQESTGLRALIFTGGILSIIAGLCSIFLGTTLIQIVTGWKLISGPVVPYFGLLGVFGGVVTLYGLARNETHVIISGGMLGLLSPSFLSVLSVIGGLLLRINIQKAAINKLIAYPKGKVLYRR